MVPTPPHTHHTGVNMHPDSDDSLCPHDCAAHSMVMVVMVVVTAVAMMLQVILEMITSTQSLECKSLSKAAQCRQIRGTFSMRTSHFFDRFRYIKDPNPDPTK